jgi:hypothetical protein
MIPTATDAISPRSGVMNQPQVLMIQIALAVVAALALAAGCYSVIHQAGYSAVGRFALSAAALRLAARPDLMLNLIKTKPVAVAGAIAFLVGAAVLYYILFYVIHKPPK